MSERSKTALSTAAHKDRRKAAGLVHAKVWVHPDETGELREFAASLPLTEVALVDARCYPPAD